jgi:hypothetical protein
MRARPAGNPGAIRNPARIRESRASVHPRNANAAVCGHACCRHWPSQFSQTHQRSRHRRWSDDLRLWGDLKTTNRSTVSFSTAGYPGRRGSVVSSVEIGLLLPQAHDDRWPAGMPLRQVRRDQVGHGAAAAQGREGCGKRTKL